MIPLIIDDKQLKELKEYAEAHPVSFDEMKQIMRGDLPPVGDRERFTCFMDYGFKLVFSIEEHPLKNGGTTWCRHMSLSLTEPSGTRVPSIIAVQLLCNSLGFKPLEHCFVRFEQQNKPQYVEVICEES